MPTDLASIADELYALPADEFTAARDAAATTAKADDAELSRAVKALKRPSASAWLVNQLVRHRADRLDDLLVLGDELRAAQDALSGDDLRRLNRERHQLVRAVVDEARALSDGKVTEQVTREVETTLDTALSDPGAGDAVRTGRLLRALSGGGFDAVDLSGAVAVPDAAPAPRSPAKRMPERRSPAKRATAKRATKAPSAAERAAEKRERARASRELAAARREAEQLGRELADRDGELTRARERVDGARARLDELEAELKAARTERTSAEKKLEKAQRDRNAAARKHRDTEQQVDKLDR